MKELVDKSFVHRDLKPENIFISDGKYKVADYGFAQKYKKGEKMNFWV
jgi:serine/threonine protein kinase